MNERMIAFIHAQLDHAGDADDDDPNFINERNFWAYKQAWIIALRDDRLSVTWEAGGDPPGWLLAIVGYAVYLGIPVNMR